MSNTSRDLFIALKVTIVVQVYAAYLRRLPAASTNMLSYSERPKLGIGMHLLKYELTWVPRRSVSERVWTPVTETSSVEPRGLGMWLSERPVTSCAL